LLEEVVRRGSRAVVVDLTGLDAIDTATTHGIQKIMRSLELVGCAVLVSGIQPSVAKAMVELQIDLAAVQSYSTLAEAIRRWMARSAR
jgi:rsbT co-antagonist protein RsbR